MVIIKKIFSTVLSVAILIIVLTGTAFGESSSADINDMAEALNKLNILQGSNGDYLLDSRLERAQAIALIIRMLGKENYVKQYADELSNTKYTDVPSDSWYAPYVGYSTKYSIVAGNPDGTFAPTEYITEKAFLKMALCALGYEYITDFDWTNVFQKAYEAGIVADESYAERTQDNTNYLRSAAVEVIYRSLNTEKKGTDTKMVFTLVDEGIFTVQELAASGIFGRDEPTEIEDITVLAPNKIEIKLSEEIQDLSIEDIIIYEASDEDSILEVRAIDFDGDILKITTDGQLPDIKYIIEINNITDAYWNITSGLTGTFYGHKVKEIKSDFFKISKIEQISASIVHVYFTHPVNANSEIPKYYEILKDDSVWISGSSQSMTVKKLQSVNNAVSVNLLNNSFTQGTVYTLRISGKLPSSYGVLLEEGTGGEMDFTAVLSQPMQLDVLSAQAWTSDSVRIVFNREVDPVWAGKKLNYTVFDPEGDEITVTNAVVNTTGDFAGREVFLSLALSLTKGYKYDLKMECIPDLYKQSVLENKTVRFSGTYPANKELSLESATSKYNNYVLLTFNKALDIAEAQNIEHYLIKGDNTSYNERPVKAFYYEEDGKYMVKLFLPKNEKLTKSKRYIIYASNLKDVLGNKTKTLEKTFTGGGENNEKWVSEAVTVSKDTVRLSFNTEIAFVPENISASNYTLEYEENGDVVKIMPIGVTYVDARTLVLRFEELDTNKTYKLDFNSIIDYSEQYTYSSGDGNNSITLKWGR